MINIKAIWDNQKPTKDIIIKTKIDELNHLNCFVATNNITGEHLYIMSIATNIQIPELKNYRFKGVSIYSLSNETEHTNEFYIYLLDSDLKDIFLLFIQNIVEDITASISESQALTITLNVISKWKKLFDKINFEGLSLERQKGLIGELLFFNYLQKEAIPTSKILNAWTAANFENKDFIFGTVGIEIKFSSSKNPKLKITSERQLDAEHLTKLFLILYTTEEVKENGFSLNSLIEQCRQNIPTTEELLIFNESLLLIGYKENDKEEYNKMYALKNTLPFTIDSDFPKIIKSQLPLGIYDTSYSIELSAVQKFILTKAEILQQI